jgi:hypothetical protein
MATAFTLFEDVLEDMITSLTEQINKKIESGTKPTEMDAVEIQTMVTVLTNILQAEDLPINDNNRRDIIKGLSFVAAATMNGDKSDDTN